MAWEEEVIGACRLIRGDCREVLPTLAAVDVIITDPPWGIDFTGKTTQVGRRGPHIKRKATYASGEDRADSIDTVVLPVLVQCRGLAPTVVVLPGNRNVWKYPPADDMGCFYSPAGTGVSRWGFSGMTAILYYGKDPYLTHGLGSRLNSFGQVDPTGMDSYGHPCAKPLAMMRWLVHRASLRGMIILDPFAGVFTTAVAAIRDGRSFVGIEIERQYFEAGCRRIEETYAQTELFRPPSRISHQLPLAVG